MDLGVFFGNTWQIIEIKLVHPYDGRQTTVEEGLKQINRYRETIDPQAPAYLVVFDRTENGRTLTWDARLTWETVDTPCGAVTVVGG